MSCHMCQISMGFAMKAQGHLHTDISSSVTPILVLVQQGKGAGVTELTLGGA